MEQLTQDQIRSLLGAVLEQTGPQPEFPEFIDVLLGILEDVPGYEGANGPEVADLIAQCMGMYRDQYRSSR